MANVLLGVTGGIAAYKSIYLLRILQADGHEVRVVMTKAAVQLTGTLTFETLSKHKVYVDDFSDREPLSHIELGKWADFMIIVPATANTIAKLAHGIADNLLTSTVLALPVPLAVCPAMNNNMYMHPATQANLEILKGRGVVIVEPATGMLACGDNAQGKLPEPDVIYTKIQKYLLNKHIAKDIKVLVVAGPTKEPIDPVRCITNHSSGKMGYAIANIADLYGADVTLITGPVSLSSQIDRTIHVNTAEEMFNAVNKEKDTCDILIMAAAVADYTPAEVAEHKIKKSDTQMQLILNKTKDILKTINKKSNQIFVGFAAESENLKENALNKLESKNLDMIAANDISRNDIGFNSEENEITLYFPDGNLCSVTKKSKKEVAKIIIEHAVKLWQEKNKK